jgi:hypothetical protein
MSKNPKYVFKFGKINFQDRGEGALILFAHGPKLV